MRVARRFGDDRLELGIQVFNESRAKLLKIHRAGAHDRGRIAIIDEREQQMLERGEFVMTDIGVLHGAVQGSFEIFGERCQSSPTLSPWCIVEGGHAAGKNP